MSIHNTDLPTAIDPERLGKLMELFHFRWTIPLLAEMIQNPAVCRVAALAATMKVGRATIRRTLTALLERDLVRVNPGYGHPLRPEYVLTELGSELAPWSLDFNRSIARRPDLKQVAFQKWPMPTLFAVSTGRVRFSELELALPRITARALSQSLRHLTQANLIQRRILDGFPVHTEYLPTARGRVLARVINRFFD